MTIIKRMALTTAIVVPALLLAGCDGTVPQPMQQTQSEEPDPETALAQIKAVQALRIKALESRDVDGAVAVYAPDATMVTPGEQPLTDLASIRASFASLLGDDKFEMIIEPGKTWVSAGADFAVTTAHIRFVGSKDGGPEGISTNSTNQSVWQKQADGTWKIESDYNVALPAAVSVAPTGAATAAPEAEPSPKAE